MKQFKYGDKVIIKQQDCFYNGEVGYIYFKNIFINKEINYIVVLEKQLMVHETTWIECKEDEIDLLEEEINL